MDTLWWSDHTIITPRCKRVHFNTEASSFLIYFIDYNQPTPTFGASLSYNLVLSCNSSIKSVFSSRDKARLYVIQRDEFLIKNQHIFCYSSAVAVVKSYKWQGREGSGRADGGSTRDRANQEIICRDDYTTSLSSVGAGAPHDIAGMVHIYTIES